MHTKKSFGQNFLQDRNIVKRIVEAAVLTKNDIVVEIGPGTGILTEALAKKAGKVIAIELDRDLIPVLLKKFPLSSNVSIIEGDILKLDMSTILERLTTNLPIGQAGDLQLTTDSYKRITKYEARDTKNKKPAILNASPLNSQLVNLLTRELNNKQFKIVSNIPYYITAPIIQKLLKVQPQPKEIILMIQKEVAERITAKPGDMSILALAVQYYAKPEILFTVPRTAFNPVPEVDSAVVRINPHTHFDAEKDKSFFRLIKVGFASRRKTLLNNISSGLHISKEEATEKLNQAKLNVNVRAQELSIKDWKKLQSTLD